MKGRVMGMVDAKSEVRVEVRSPKPSRPKPADPARRLDRIGMADGWWLTCLFEQVLHAGVEHAGEGFGMEADPEDEHQQRARGSESRAGPGP